MNPRIACSNLPRRRGAKTIALVLATAALFAAGAAHSSLATQCIRIVEWQDPDAPFEACAAPVRYALCNTETGLHQVVGLCGGELDGSSAAENLHWGIYPPGCRAPYVPTVLRFSGSGIEGQCRL